MLHPRGLSAWTQTVSTILPHLSRAQIAVLASYSFASMLVQGAGISQVTAFLAELLGQSENTVRQRLRETLYDMSDKRGDKRREVEVDTCFAPLLSWVLGKWRSDDGLVLAMDAITLRQAFTVLVISVVVGRNAIPVAWTVVSATKKEAWKPHWRRMLRELRGLTGDRPVWMAADRGLYARWLFRDLRACGWHPLLRINARGSVVIRETGQRFSLAFIAERVRGGFWHGQVVCFRDKRRQLACTLLALWDEGQQEAWLLVTDLPPGQTSPAWYSLRMWIEAGFKALKTGGLHWERTRMTDPARAERLWLVMALAVTGAACAAPSEPPLSDLPRLSLVRRGLIRILAACVRGDTLPPLILPAFHLPPPPTLEFIPL